MSKAQWTVDASHSHLEFSIRHMMIAKVKGTFENFEATIQADPEDLTTADIEFQVELASINTRNNDRDAHLKSADFFDVEQHPKMVFKATNITKSGDGEYKVSGDLSMHGVTRQETFHVVYEGSGKDPWGNEKAGFSGKGVIKRSDFGLTWNAALETGGVLVGDDVSISFEIEAAKQAE